MNDNDVVRLAEQWLISMYVGGDPPIDALLAQVDRVDRTLAVTVQLLARELPGVELKLSR